MRIVGSMALTCALIVPACGSADIGSAETCGDVISALMDSTQDYLNVVSETPPSDPATDQILEAQETIEGEVSAMQTRVGELECDTTELEGDYCDSYEDLDTGSFGRQWLDQAGFPNCDNGFSE